MDAHNMVNSKGIWFALSPRPESIRIQFSRTSATPFFSAPARLQIHSIAFLVHSIFKDMKRGFSYQETPPIKENWGKGLILQDKDIRSLLYSNGQDGGAWDEAAVRESRVPPGIRAASSDSNATTMRPSEWPEDLPGISISDARKYGNAASDWDLPAAKKSKTEADLNDAMIMDVEKTQRKTWTSETEPSIHIAANENENENEKRPNPFAGVPFITTAFRTSPRHDLGVLYAKLPSRFILKDESFFTWPSKELKRQNGATFLFTAMFVCPLTLERYPAGRIGNPKDYKVDSNGTVWYARKKMAVDGVSARVISCLHHRGQGRGRSSRQPIQLGKDIPYLQGEGPALPPLPADVEEKVERQVAIFKAEADERAQEEMEQHAQVQEEEEAFGQDEGELGRQAYRDQQLR
jgi:hypothetical protein